MHAVAVVGSLIKSGLVVAIAQQTWFKTEGRISMAAERPRAWLCALLACVLVGLAPGRRLGKPTPSLAQD